MQYKEKKRKKNISLLRNNKTKFCHSKGTQSLHINILQRCSIVAMVPIKPRLMQGRYKNRRKKA